MSKLITILLKGTTMLVFLSCFGNAFAQAQNIGEKKELQSPTPKSEENAQFNVPKTQPSAEKFQVTTKDEPQGNSLEVQIARAEFYKAQYAHDPATQAKYQQSIDMMKAELLKANSNSKE